MENAVVEMLIMGFHVELMNAEGNGRFNLVTSKRGYRHAALFDDAEGLVSATSASLAWAREINERASG